MAKCKIIAVVVEEEIIKIIKEENIIIRTIRHHKEATGINHLNLEANLQFSII